MSRRRFHHRSSLLLFLLPSINVVPPSLNRNGICMYSIGRWLRCSRFPLFSLYIPSAVTELCDPIITRHDSGASIASASQRIRGSLEAQKFGSLLQTPVLDESKCQQELSTSSISPLRPSYSRLYIHVSEQGLPTTAAILLLSAASLLSFLPSINTIMCNVHSPRATVADMQEIVVQRLSCIYDNCTCDIIPPSASSRHCNPQLHLIFVERSSVLQGCVLLDQDLLAPIVVGRIWLTSI